jgi:hypothetical protein
MVLDRLISFLPESLSLCRVGEVLSGEKLRTNPHYQDLFVVTAVEDADAAPFRKPFVRPPEKIVLEFLGGRLFEGKNLAAGRVDSPHHRANGAVLAGGVHGLKDQQKGKTVIRVEDPLEVVEPANQSPKPVFIRLLPSLSGRWRGGASSDSKGSVERDKVG